MPAFNIKRMVRSARVDLPLISEDVRRLNGVAIDDLLAESKKKKRNKYNACRTKVGDKAFDSAWEAERYGELHLQERAGVIQNLQTHLPFRLQVNGVHVCNYEADFVYVRNGKLVVEDAKGNLTREYKIKRALMLAVHGIKIEETRRGK